jgi:multiple sugar transport system substrate-binding protein
MKKETKLSRRQLLRLSAVAGTGALVAACAPAAPTAAPAAPAAPTEAPATAPTEAPKEEPKPTEAPAAAAGGTVQVLNRQEYFPALGEEIQKQTEEFIKSIGYEPDVSSVNPEVFGDFMAKMQAAVAAGNPPDLAYHGVSISQMYDSDIVNDVSDIVNELVEKYGDIVPANTPRFAKFDDKWWSVPFITTAGAWFVRKDVAEAAGVDLNDFSTLEKRRDAALKMSDPSKEMYGWGLTYNKSGDAQGTITTAFQAFGGRAVDESGTKVTFNSPETVEGVKFLAGIFTDEKFKPMIPPGIESWTDPSNNEAYLAGKIGMTQNAFSVYAKAKLDANPVYEKTAVVRFPMANDGSIELGSGGAQWYTIFKGVRQPDAARQIILHFIDPVVFTPLSGLGGGLFMPAYKNNWTDDLLKLEPAFPALKDIMFNPTDYTGFAYPAQPNAAIDASFALAFLPEMMANIITGKMTAEQAVEDGHKKMVAIFEEKGLPQS